MADLSLDAYIANTTVGKSGMRGNLANRLGGKVRGGGGGRGRGGPFGGRGRGGPNVGGRGGSNISSRLGPNVSQQAPKFNVVGLSKVNRGFDARQKLSSNNPLKTAVQDAREKIRPKTAFDARQAIGKKQNQDVRSKIDSMKARKPVDARQKINARQGKPQSPPNTEQHITVMGGVRQMIPSTAVSLMSGSLTKTIRSAPMKPMMQMQKPIMQKAMPMAPLGPLTRTVNNNQPMPIPTLSRMAPRTPVMRSPPPPSNNLVITKKNTSVTRAPQQQQPMSRSTISLRGIRSPSSQQWIGTESTLRSDVGSTGTVVSIKNEMYSPRGRQDDDNGQNYPHPPPPVRSAGPPHSVQPTTVWEAIQSVTTKRTPESHVPQHVPAHVPVTDTVSPLQGYRVLVTNLHPIVSQDDILELFSAVGSLKKARLIKPGTAEAIFVTKEEALAAVRKYHMRELDGLPMQLVLTSRGGGPEPGTPASSQRPITTQPNPNPQSPPESKGPLRLGQLSQNNGKQLSTVDPNLIHKALFKTGSRDEPVRPVTFTVKI